MTKTNVPEEHVEKNKKALERILMPTDELIRTAMLKEIQFLDKAMAFMDSLQPILEELLKAKQKGDHNGND